MTNPKLNSRRTKISTREPSRRSLKRGGTGMVVQTASLSLIEDPVDRVVEDSGSKENPSKKGGQL